MTRPALLVGYLAILCFTIGLAILQSTTLVAIARNPGGLFTSCASDLVPSDSMTTILIMIITLTAGTGLIMWLGELVTEKGIGESAAVVWREIQKQQVEVFGVRTAESASVDAESVIDAQPEEGAPSLATAPLFTFDTPVAEIGRRKGARRASTAQDQLSLFGA